MARSSKTLRYPQEFTVDTPTTDYIEFYAVRPKFGENFRKGGIKYNYHPTRVILNVPQKVVENHSQNWNNAALGELTPDSISRLISPFRTENQGTPLPMLDQIGEVGNLGIRFAEQKALEAAVKGMQTMGASGITPNGILSATGGIVYNPNLEILYEGPDFRTFNFQFVLFNKSEGDAQEIYNIVEWFREQSVPSLNNRADFGNGSGAAGGDSNRPDTDTGNTPSSAGWSFNSKSRFLAQPPFILMTYKRGAGDHPFMRPLLPAALNSVSVDYTPTGNYTVMNDFDSRDKATTVAANITIQLTERTNLTYEDLKELQSAALSGNSSRTYRAPE